VLRTHKKTAETVCKSHTNKKSTTIFWSLQGSKKKPEKSAKNAQDSHATKKTLQKTVWKLHANKISTNHFWKSHINKNSFRFVFIRKNLLPTTNFFLRSPK
jgi:hypothetical protein